MEKMVLLGRRVRGRGKRASRRVRFGIRMYSGSKSVASFRAVGIRIKFGRSVVGFRMAIGNSLFPFLAVCAMPPIS